MIEYKKSLNRFYDTKTKKIVSSAKAFQYALKHGKHSVAVAKGKPKKHMSKYARPSYKKMYEHAVKQLKAMEHQYSAHEFHPFIANRTKDGDVSPKTNIHDINEFLKHHTGKLFVVAALGSDNHYDVEACGSVNDLTVAGFASRDLVPELISMFEDGYND